MLHFFKKIFSDCQSFEDKFQKIFAVTFWGIVTGALLFAALINTPENIILYFATIFAIEFFTIFIGFILYKVFGLRGVISYAILSTLCTIGLFLWFIVSTT